jgi:hypothetical protein
MSMSDPPAAPPIALRNALVDAIGGRRRRIRSRLAVAGGVCVAVAAAVLAGGMLTGGSPERALAIDDGNEWVTVRILDGEAGAAEMTQELQDAGIEGEVQLVPAVHRFVGGWMGVAQDPACGEGCSGLADTNARLKGDVFRIKRAAIRKLAGTRAILYVGRKPDAGETARDFPPRNHDLRVIPFGSPGNGSGSWAQALNPIHVRRAGSN